MTEPVGHYDPYQLVEGWWGESLTEQLINRMANAPRAHLDSFFDHVQSVEGTRLPSLPKGAVRPILKNNGAESWRGRGELQYLKTALSMLLYADEVAVEEPLFLGIPDRNSLREVLHGLLRLQPLAASGAVTFFRYPGRYRHPSRSLTPTSIEDPTLVPGYENLFREFERLSEMPRDYDYDHVIFRSRMELGVSLQIAAEVPGRLNVLAVSAEEAAMLPVALWNAAVSSEETARLHLAKLASLDLPALSGDAVAAVRASSDEFAEWRSAIRIALAEVDEISDDDPNWHAYARTVLADGLAPVRNKVETAVRQSPALTVAKKGLMNLSYSGVGALAGAAVGGNPVIAIAGAAAGKVGELGVEYLKAVQERRRDRAILDLAMSFYGPTGA